MKTQIIKITVVAAIFTLSLNFSFAQGHHHSTPTTNNFYTTQDGSWSSRSTWSNNNEPGSWINNHDTVFISHSIDMNQNIGLGNAVIVIEENGTLSTSRKSLTLNYSGSGVINYGSVEVNYLRIWGGTFTNNGELTVDNQLYASGSSSSFDNQGTILIKNDFIAYSGAYTNSGTFIVNDDFKFSGTFTNNGSIIVIDQLNNQWSGYFTNNGTIILTSLTNDKFFTNNGDITVSGSLSNNYSGEFTNSGNMTIENDLLNYNTITNNSGSITLKGKLENSWSTTLNNNAYFEIKNLISNKGTFNNTDSLVIYSTFMNESSSSKFNNSGKFILKKDENGYGSMIDNGSYTENGKTEISLFLKGGEWHYISAPISNGTTNSFWGAAVYSYDENTGEWVSHGANEDLDPMKGYDVYYKEDKTITFRGKLNKGTHRNSNLTTSNDSFHLIGNPYMSAIDWGNSSWTKSNIENAIYVWDPNTQNITSYVNGSGINGGSRYIAPMQAFFIKVNATPGLKGTLQMDQNVQVDNQTISFREDETAPDVLRIKVNAFNGYTDETIIRFNEKASEEFDANQDARKLYSFNNQVPQIYTKSIDSKELSINTLPEFNDMISSPLYVKTGVSGTHSIEASLEDFPECMNIFIEDLKENTIHDLLASPYEYDADVNDDKGRFIIYFSLPKQISNNENTATSIESNTTGESDVNIFARNKSVFVQINSTENVDGNISVFDLSGKQIVSAKYNSSNINKIDINASTAYYIVTVALENGNSFSEKVFID